jgi:predicted PurR-regulated permease PerM
MSAAKNILAPLKSFAKVPTPDAAKILTVFVMSVAILYFGKEVLVPVTVALLLAFILAPIVDLLGRWRLGRVPSVLIAVFVALGVIVAIGSVIGTQVADLTNDLPRYTPTIKAKINKVEGATVGKLSRWADELGPQDKVPAGGQPQPAQSQANEQSGGSAAQQAPIPAPMSLARQYLTTVLSPLATFAIVFVVAIFALLQREDLRNRLVRLIGTDDLHHTVVAIDDAGRRLSRYFLTQLSINAVFAVVIGVGLLIIGVPNPVLWGLLSGLLRFVPYVGSIISAVFPIALAAAVDPGWTMVLWTTALYGIVEPLTGQFIEPMIYGNNTGLSPFSVVVAAIFWSWLWGPVGLLLSTPLTLCLVVIGRHAKRLEYLDILLGDQPALTPVEIFYQRILAADPEEALDHAEQLLKEVSLAAYYDEVAIAGLRRAAKDARRGAIGRKQQECIERAMDVVVSGIETYLEGRPQEEDKAPNEAAPANRQIILCIPGRSPLDEAASVMLVQLLVHKGMSARLVPFAEVADDGVAALDTDGVIMTCICQLEISGSPAGLRRLVRRLRPHLPKGTPVIAGLWGANDPVLKDDAVQAEIGADRLASSLGEIVAFSVDVTKA